MPAKAPDWMVVRDNQGGRGGNAPAAPPSPAIATDRRVRRAQAYLAKIAGSIQGQNGSRLLRKAACKLVGKFCLPRELALDLLRTDFNPRCEPSWSEKELAHAVDRARTTHTETPLENEYQELNASEKKLMSTPPSGSPSHTSTTTSPQQNGSGAESVSWDKPLALELAPAAPFPLDALPGPIRDFAEAVALALPCPVDMPAVAALTAAATLIGNTRRLQVKATWHEGPRLYAAIVCPTGTKKSPALSAALAPLREIQKELQHAFDLARAEYEQALTTYESQLLAFKKAAAKAQEEGKEMPPAPIRPSEPVCPQTITTDTTREALADLMAVNHRGVILVQDELTGWTLAMNQYRGGKGSDRQFFLSLWSGVDQTVNRRGRPPVHLHNPLGNVVGCIPPGVLSELDDERGREDGFVHRVLFSWPDPVPPGWSDAEIDSHTAEAYADHMRQLFNLEADKDAQGMPCPRTLHFTHQARERFAQFVTQNALEFTGEEFPDSLRGPWAKFEGYCARLTLVLYVCRRLAGETESEEVDLASVENAIRMVDYFKSHARRVYPRLLSRGTDLLHKDAAAVLAWVRRNRDKIEAQQPPQFSWRAVRHDLRERFHDREEDLHKALKHLEGKGYVREVHAERQGARGPHPKPDYHVNPATWQPDQADQMDQKTS